MRPSSAAAAAVLAAVLSSAVVASSTPTPLQVNVTTPPVPHSVAPEYISFNFDWHLNDEFGWINASILTLNLSDTRLRTLAAALAPAHLRVGGSQGDMVVYDVRGTECAQASTKFANTTFCLTMARWEEINDFAASTGLTIAMGLNCMAGRDAKGDGFNISNLADFLACAYVCSAGPGHLRSDRAHPPVAQRRAPHACFRVMTCARTRRRASPHPLHTQRPRPPRRYGNAYHDLCVRV